MRSLPDILAWGLVVSLGGVLTASHVLNIIHASHYNEDPPSIALPPACSTDEYIATIEYIVDADTYDLRVRLPYLPRPIYIVERVRLAKVDAPERHTKEGKAAASYVAEWFDRNYQVIYQDLGKDKYGRRIARLESTSTAQSLADALIGSGHAVPYLAK